MSISQSPKEFSETTFDYIVIGGGNAGLPLAVRLAEDPHVKVGLLEAGSVFAEDDPLITNPSMYRELSIQVLLDVERNEYHSRLDGYGGQQPSIRLELPNRSAAARRAAVVPASSVRPHLSLLSSASYLLSKISVYSGKGLGGTTLLNYMVWDRASKAEYDSFQALSSPPNTNANPNPDAELDGAQPQWDWSSLLPYFKKVEDVSAEKDVPNPFVGMSLDGAEAGVVENGHSAREASGWEGPVKLSYNALYTDVIEPIIKSFNSLGVPTNSNQFGGETEGIKNLRRTIDKDTGKRIDAASAYLKLAKDSKNLFILPNAVATKLSFSPSASSGTHTVRGVEFTVNGQKYEVSASREVVLCCGAVQTPQLLELSGTYVTSSLVSIVNQFEGLLTPPLNAMLGIGSKSLLTALGIPSIVDLPGVGENLHDHIFVPIQYLLRPGVRTFDQLRNDPAFLEKAKAEFTSSGQGWLAASDTTAIYTPLHRHLEEAEYTSFLDSLHRWFAEARDKNELSPLQIAQYQIQSKWLEENSTPNLETIVFSKGVIAPEEGKAYFTMLTGLQQPFSRGSVHIASADPLQPPKIDPNYLANDFDTELLVAGFQFMEKAADVSYLKEIIEAQTVPPVPLSREQLKGFIQQAVSSGGHLMGTAPIARRDLGGVVDNKLKVYGTSNLRIVDASVIPIPIATHLQATIYAIAERAADMIKDDLKHK
ncbi:hypothetical protein CVT26_008801 [Gymnopilus dilepis]|uniref:pyranose dehydrogenase (acceptor) n=1 Tax=Gymnopilus dilepis TaxID=231916 RepID=A0A409YSG1_9AGAR|nr:hypothetical protein CVT26_008801 [Gymnopilus dilepis]